MFSLEEVECIGACSWAPAVQVNYDFHENLTTEKMDKFWTSTEEGGDRKSELEVRCRMETDDFCILTSNSEFRMADLVSHPDEVKVVSKRFGTGRDQYRPLS